MTKYHMILKAFGKVPLIPRDKWIQKAALRSEGFVTPPTHHQSRADGEWPSHAESLRCALHFAEAVLTALSLSGVRIVKRHYSLNNWLRRRALAVYHDPEYQIPEFKRVITLIRERYLLSRFNSIKLLDLGLHPRDLGKVLPKCLWNMKSYFTFTFVGRALPRPTFAVSELAKRVAVDTFRQPFEADPVALDHLKYIIEVASIRFPRFENVFRVTRTNRLAIKRVADHEEHVYPVFGTSACTIATRKEGGRASVLQKVGLFCSTLGLMEPPSDPLAGREVLPIRKSRSDYFLDEVEYASVTATSMSGMDVRVPGSEKQFPLSDLRESKVTSVDELGFKARVVTKSHPTLVTTGHELRSVYFPILRRWKATRECLDDAPDIIRFVKSRRRKVSVFNADLKKATDGLNHSVVRFFCDAVGIPATLIFDGLTVEGYPLKRGIFMGLPMSWTILSIIHYVVASAVDRSRNFRIKGDDLIALWDDEQILLYSSLIAACGCEVNKTKTFRSYTKGFFCERLYIGRWSGRFLVLVKQETATVRAFFPDREASSISLSTLVVPQHRYAAFNRTVQIKFKPLLSLAKSYRLNPYLPVRLGGSGLLRPNPSWQVRSKWDQIFIQSAFSGLPLIDPTLQLRPVAGSHSAHLLDVLRKIRYLPLGAGPLCPHVESAVRVFSSACAITDAFRGILPRRNRNKDVYRSLCTLHKRVKGIPYEITYGDAEKMKLFPFRGSVDCELCRLEVMPGAYPG